MGGFNVAAARKAGYTDDEILTHLTQSRKFDIQAATKAGYSKQEIIDHLSQTMALPGPTTPPSLGGMYGPVGDIGTGIVKQIGRMGANLANLVPGVTLPVPQAANPTEQAAMTGTEVASYFVPWTKVANVPKLAVLASRVPLAKTLLKVGDEAVGTGMIALANTGNPETAMYAGTTTGAIGLLGGPIGDAMRRAGGKIQLSTIRPRRVDMDAGFTQNSMEGLKGNLAMAYRQVTDKLKQLRFQRKPLLDASKGYVDIGAAFNSAKIDLEKEITSLKNLGQAESIRTAFKSLQNEMIDIVGPHGLADIERAENAKEAIGLLGIWSHVPLGTSAALDPFAVRQANATEKVANSIYLKLKTAIEGAIPAEAAELRRLNGEMGRLIPLRNAMIARIPVEERNRVLSLGDITSMLPALITGSWGDLGLVAATRLQKNLRFGNWLVRRYGSATEAARALGDAAAYGVSKWHRPGIVEEEKTP